jgi:hypothetical protein
MKNIKRNYWVLGYPVLLLACYLLTTWNIIDESDFAFLVFASFVAYSFGAGIGRNSFFQK